MSGITKFQFDTDFADPAAGAGRRTRAPDDGDRPTFSEDDLAAARQSGYESGIGAGRAQAMASIEKRIEELLGTVAERLGALSDELDERRALTRADVAVLARTIAAKVAGTGDDEARLEVVARLVDACLDEIYGVEAVTVAVDPALVQALEARIVKSVRNISVTVLGEPSLGGSECRIDWPGGGARRLDSELWARIDAVLGRYISPAEDGAGEREATEEDTISGDEHG